jgi:hypothetical protein
MIKEEWQAQIVARDFLDNVTMISAIANRLYPDIFYSRSREDKLLEIPEMGRLALICYKRAKKLDDELNAWLKKKKTTE